MILFVLVLDVYFLASGAVEQNSFASDITLPCNTTCMHFIFISIGASMIIFSCKLLRRTLFWSFFGLLNVTVPARFTMYHQSPHLRKTLIPSFLSLFRDINKTTVFTIFVERGWRSTQGFDVVKLTGAGTIQTGDLQIGILVDRCR